MTFSTFQSNILNIYGHQGALWLKRLDRLVQEISLQLGLRNLEPVENLSYNYVLSGFREEAPIILKLGLDLETEIQALTCFDGHGAVNIRAHADEWLLLERAIPGTPLASQTVEIACRIIQKLHQAPIPHHHNFPHIKDWLSILDKNWELPFKYLQKARQLRNQLLRTSDSDVLLHGDLHPGNILKNGNDWLVIDPKGVIGSPINEVWACVMDLEHDIPFVAQYFGWNVQELFNWYFIHVILAVCWNLEDHADTSFFMSLADKAYCYVL